MKYKYYGKPTNWERWGNSIAVVKHTCPKCKAPKEYQCSTPSGKEKWPPHVERYRLLTKKEIKQTIGGL